MEKMRLALPGAILILLMTGSVMYAQEADIQAEEPEMQAGESESQAEGPGNRIERFDIPLYRGYRLDWCLVWAGHCGKDAAHVFCLSQGYWSVYSYSAAWDVGQSMVIGTNQLCSHPSCDSFSYITCW